MPTPSRIYVIRSKGSENDPDQTSLVRAPTKSQALRHVAESCFIATVASQEELVQLLQHGVEVENAGEEPDPFDADGHARTEGDPT